MKHKKTQLPFVIITALIVAIVVIILFVSKRSEVNITLTKQDYKTAQTDIGALSTSYSNFLIDSRSDFSSADTIKSVATKLQQATDNFDRSYKQLGLNKAIVNDKKLANLYKQLERKKSKFDELSVVLQEEYLIIIPVLQDIKVRSSKMSEQALVEFIKNEFSKSGEFKSDINKTFIGDITGVNKYNGRQLSYPEALKRWEINVERINKDADISKLIEEISNEVARKIRNLE